MATVAAAPEVALGSEELAGIRQRTTWSLLASQVFGSGGSTAGITVSSILAASILGASTWAGTPNSVRVLGAALISLPLSAYMARVGRRRGLALGYAIGLGGAILSIGAAVLASFPLLLLGSLVFGAGYSSTLLSRYAAADVSSASQRGKAISFVVWGSTVGAVVGPNFLDPSGRWAEALGFPALAGPFFLSVVTFGAAATLIFLLLRPDPLHVARQLARQEAASGDISPARPTSVLLWQPRVQIALVTLIASHMVMIAIMSMAPVYMHDHGHDLHVVGLVISGHVIGMYVFSPLTGWLCDRIGRLPMIFLGVVTFLSAVLVDALAPPSSAGLLITGVFLIGLGWNFGFVAGSALLTDACSQSERPRMQGLADMVMGVAAAVGSLGSGVLLESGGYGTLNFYAGSLVILPLMVIWLRHRAVTEGPALSIGS